MSTKTKWKSEDQDLKVFLATNPAVPPTLRAWLGEDPEWWEAVALSLRGLPSLNDLEREFATMTAWLNENPGRTPQTRRGAKQFVRSWLKRSFV